MVDSLVIGRLILKVVIPPAVDGGISEKLSMLSPLSWPWWAWPAEGKLNERWFGGFRLRCRGADEMVERR